MTLNEFTAFEESKQCDVLTMFKAQRGMGFTAFNDAVKQDILTLLVDASKIENI